MPVIPFVGPSYQTRSRNFDAQRAVNQYLVKSETKTSKSPAGMQGTPGRIAFSTVGPDSIRNQHVAKNRLFVSSGLYLYEVKQDGTFTQLGMFKTQYGPMAMENNGLQVMMVDGPNGYILQLANNNNLIVDGTFDSANIIQNGTFDTDTIWSKGAGWTIAGGKGVATGAISTTLSQECDPVTSDAYIVTYTVTVTAGSITANIGGTVGTARTTSGTYTETLIAGATVGFAFTTSGFTGSVDNVTATPVDINWTQGAGWTIANGVAMASGAISTSLSQGISLTPNVTYQVTYTITQSAGTITPILMGNPGTVRSSGGTYTDNIVAGTGKTFEFDTSGFTGTVDNVSITQPNDYFVNITDPYFLGSDTIAFIDGYFILNKPGSSEYYLSNSYDGTTGDPLEFEQVEGFTDQLIAVHAVHNQLWLFGKTAIEIASDTGDTFPFTPVQGIFIEYGCAAAQSIVSNANTVFWLGNDRQGHATVWMANGYQPTRISTDPVEYAIQEYGDISTAVGYAYQENGHYFYALNFAGATTTWVYDVNEQEWHERCFYNLSSGQFERDKAQNHVFCFGKHLVGDYETGIIYDQSLDYYTDNGSPLRRLRAAPHMSDDLEYIFHQIFQLDMQTGVGLTTGNIADTAPTMALQWSDDGGYTWSNEHWQPVGAKGAYATRLIWRMLGRSRDRVYRVIYSAATPYFIIAAHANTVKGTS